MTRKVDARAALEEQRRLVLRIKRTAADARRRADSTELVDFVADAQRLADLALALDEQASTGTLPPAWQPPQRGLF